MNNKEPLKAGISLKDTVIACIYGAVVWYLAALTCMIVGIRGGFEGTNAVIVYLLVIPGTVPFVLIYRKISKLTGDKFIIGYALATSFATLLDGTALRLFPSLYGTEISIIAGSGAVILWGVGVGIFEATWLAGRQSG